jgi:uncharacterized protein YjiS (DUF1127 family)
MAKTDFLIGSHPLPPVSRALFALAAAVLRWETRRATRCDLRNLDAHLLHDIGVTRSTALHEAGKPFWRA